MTGGLAAVFVVVVLLSGSVLWIGSERAKALDAARDSRYESLAQRLLRILWRNREIEWSDEARPLVDEMAAVRKDDWLKGLAIATAEGLVLDPSGSIPQGGASIAIDGEGRRLLVSGFVIAGYAGEPRGTAIWDLATRNPHSSTIGEAGPVAFRSDGTPIQLTADGSRALRLWDVSRNRPLSTFPTPWSGPLEGALNRPPSRIPAHWRYRRMVVTSPPRLRDWTIDPRCSSGTTIRLANGSGFPVRPSLSHSRRTARS